MDKSRTPRTASDHRELGAQHGRAFSSQPLEGTSSADTRILDLNLPEPGEYVSKPGSLWHFVMGAQEN